MSTETPPDPANSPHLDDAAVSAALDAEATADELAHLRACARCRAAVDRLRAVSEVVAAPVVIDTEAREAAIDAAIAAYRPVGDRPPGPAAAPVTPLARRRGWRDRATAPWLGIAAALLLVVLAVPLLRGNDVRDEETSAADRATSEGAGAAADSSIEESEDDAPATPVDVGDLGALEREADLRPVIDEALGPAREEEDAVQPEQGADEDQAATRSQEGVESGAAGGSEEGSTAAAPADEGPQPGNGACEGAVRAALPEAGPLLLTGSATVEGAPALVYGFSGPGERATVLAALVRRDGCELLTFQSYARG